MADRLLIRFGSMGDVILATAAANALRERHGEQCVDVAVKAEWAGVWSGHPAVDRLYAWSPEERRLRALPALLRTLAERKYQEIFDLQGSLRSRTITAALRPRVIRRPRRWHVARRRLVRYQRWGPPPGFSVRRAFVDTVSPQSRAMPSVHPSPQVAGEAAARYPTLACAVAPGARHATKRWPLERFVEVARRWTDQSGHPAAVFFGPDEPGMEDAWRRAWPEPQRWIAVREGLEMAAAVLARAPRLFANDTGLMHLATAVGTPVTAVFGPTVRELGFYPQGPDDRVVENSGLSCRPCSLHGTTRCPRGHFRCMLELSVDEVLACSGPPGPGGNLDRAVTR